MNKEIKNKRSVRIETRNIYHDNVDTGESIYSFFISLQHYPKRLMSEEISIF